MIVFLMTVIIQITLMAKTPNIGQCIINSTETPYLDSNLAFKDALVIL
jgi:hypothetical protein